jgi:hypothetical protein
LESNWFQVIQKCYWIQSSNKTLYNKIHSCKTDSHKHSYKRRNLSDTKCQTFSEWNKETQIMHLTNIIIIMVEKWNLFQPVKRLCWKYIIHFSYLNESWWHKLQNLYPGSIFLDLVLHNLSLLAHICIHLPFIHSLIYYAFC